MMVEPIRGKVARVLNAREIAINIGTQHGVDIGMYFDIIDPVYLDIIDPDTGKVLGSIDQSKVRVKVTRVLDNLAVASTYKAKRVNLGGDSIYPTPGFGPIARSLMPTNWVTEYETLEKTNGTPEPFDEKDSKVKTGDPVVQVLDVDEIEKENTNEK